VYFHDFAPGSEPFRIEVQAVHRKRKILEKAVTVGGNLKFSAEPVALTYDFAVGSHNTARGVAHLETHFAAQALSRGPHRAQCQKEPGQAEEKKRILSNSEHLQNGIQSGTYPTKVVPVTPFFKIPCGAKFDRSFATATS
jgi:hypothetical protein